MRFESKFPGPVQTVAGAFYTYGSAHTIQGENTPYDATGAPAFVENIPSNNREIAEFLDVSYDVTSALQLSAGVRESQLRNFSAYIANGWINGGPSNSPSKHSEHALTPRYTVKYKLTDDAMLYADAAKGYRIDWKKIQQSVLLACTYHITENAGAATSTGAEFEADLAPMAGLALSLSLGYDDAKITAAPGGSAFVVGQPLNGVPKMTGSLLADYSHPVAIGSAYLRGQYSFTGRSTSYATNPAGISRSSYSLVNLRAGVGRGLWEVGLFAKNLFDVRADLGEEQSEVAAPGGRPRFLIAQPRSVGIEIRRGFD